MLETPNMTWYLVSEIKLQEIVEEATDRGRFGGDPGTYLAELFANAEDMDTPEEQRNRADAGGSGLVRFKIEVEPS